MRTAGYSGTPLATKLGIKGGTEIHAVGAPADYHALLSPLPPGAVIKARLSTATQVVHVFSTRKTELAKRLKTYRRSLRSDGALWVSWPKQAAKVPTDITEDVIRDLALPLGFVDIKVCAVTDVWSGLKLVVRKELR